MTTSPEDALRSLEKTRGSVGTIWRRTCQHPTLAVRLGNLGDYLRFAGSLNPATREAIILLVANRLECSYIWEHHIVPAMDAGLSSEEIQQLKRGDTSFLQERELVAMALRSLDHEQEFPPPASAEAEAIEAVVLAGYYAMMAQLTRLYGL